MLPCWNNIIPGHTSISDAKQIMESSQTVTVVTYFDYLQEVDFIMSFAPLNIHSVYGSISADDGIVSVIWTSGKTGITIDDVIAQNGIPEYVISTPFGGGGNTLVILYSDQGIATMLPKQVKEVSRFTKIGALVLFDTQKFLLSDNNLPIGELEGKNLQELIYQWKGYGEINDLYPPK